MSWYDAKARDLFRSLVMDEARSVPRIATLLESVYAEGWNAAVAELEPDPSPSPVAPADPCQRCGKLGGHGVDFSFDGISMSSWICPHCLDAQEKRIAQMEAAIRWACGETDFVPPEGNPAKYWWRYELYRRSGLKALDEKPAP